MPVDVAQREKRSQDAQALEDETAENRAKALVILDACSRQDIGDLKELAVSKGGFLSDAIRREACKSNYPGPVCHAGEAYIISCRAGSAWLTGVSRHHRL